MSLVKLNFVMLADRVQLFWKLLFKTTRLQIKTPKHIVGLRIGPHCSLYEGISCVSDHCKIVALHVVIKQFYSSLTWDQFSN